MMKKAMTKLVTGMLLAAMVVGLTPAIQAEAASSYPIYRLYGMTLKNLNDSDVLEKLPLFGNWKRDLIERNWFYLGNEKNLPASVMCYVMQDTFQFGKDSTRFYSSAEDLVDAYHRVGEKVELGTCHYIIDGTRIDEKYLDEEGATMLTVYDGLDADALRFALCGPYHKEAVAMAREIARNLPDMPVYSYQLKDFKVYDEPKVVPESEPAESSESIGEGENEMEEVPLSKVI